MTSPRLMAIGDIHGCDRALETLLQKLDITSDDTLIILGDMINRGANSRRVIEMLLEMQKACHLVTIKGNHEEMVLEVVKGRKPAHLWMEYGGKSTLESYGGSISNIPKSHIDFMEDCLPYFETEQYVFTHANLEPGVALGDQDKQFLRWQKFKKNQPVWEEGRTVVVGHTPQSSGLPTLIDGWMCIDTYAYAGMMLTAADLTNDLFYQTHTNGNFRATFSYDELRMLMA
ncbi:metallophosphoesterase family protein [Lacunimicrobium album]